jgi:hypothetical protein
VQGDRPGGYVEGASHTSAFGDGSTVSRPSPSPGTESRAGGYEAGARDADTSSDQQIQTGLDSTARPITTPTPTTPAQPGGTPSGPVAMAPPPPSVTTLPTPAPRTDGRTSMPVSRPGDQQSVGGRSPERAGKAAMGGRAVGTPANGIVGGSPRPLPSYGTSVGGGLPRGTVIGGSGGSGAMSTGGKPAAGFPPAVGGSTAPPPVGGSPMPKRPHSQGTPAGAASSASSARTAFTPGGTGLVRGAPIAGAPVSGTPARGSDRRDSERRPDYLTEDEATWKIRRSVVPPVIDE